MPTKHVSSKKISHTVSSQKSSGAYFYAVGRRKSAVARVRLYKTGDVDFLVNEKPLKTYFHNFFWEKIVLEPLKLLQLDGKVRVSVKVTGGGPKGQAEAVRHGVSRALLLQDPEFRAELKRAGFLKRDPRVKERKKYGLKRARRAPQWSKR